MVEKSHYLQPGRLTPELTIYPKQGQKLAKIYQEVSINLRWRTQRGEN